MEQGEELEPGSFVYVFYNGHLWRELAVVEDGKVQEVDLARSYGKNRRVAWGDAEAQLEVPAEGTVEIAVAPVQWSWARVLAFGGLHPSDPRKGEDTIEGVELVDDGKRTARLTLLDLSQLQEETWPEPWCKPGDFADREDLKPYQGKELPVFHADDPIGIARLLAAEYQYAWADLEDYIAEISDPKNKDKHPYSPWFDSAVLSNQYFFVEHPDVEVTGVLNVRSPEEKDALRKAKEQREEWRRYLSLGDIQTALGIERRRELREKIKESKLPLVEYLSNQRQEDSPFIAAVDDLATLPPGEEGYKGCEQLYILADQLFTRLADHEFIRDHHLETEPPTKKELFDASKNDPGAKLLMEIANADSGHALHGRLFPPEGEGDQNVTTTQNVVPDNDPFYKSEKLLSVGRRFSQALSAWISHYASLAADNLKIQKSIVRFITDGKLSPLLEGLELKEMTLEKYLLGSAPKGYDFLRVEVKGLDEKLKEKAHLFDGGEVADSSGNSHKVDLINHDGKPFGTTTLSAFKEGRGFTNTAWKHKRKAASWLQQTVEVWVGNKLKRTEDIARSTVDKGGWTKGVLPLVGVLEAWNLQKSVFKMMEALDEGKATSRDWVDFAGAIADSAAIGSSIYEGYQDARVLSARFNGRNFAPNITKSRAFYLARGLGAGAGFLSAYASFSDMVANYSEGDDASIAHGVMGAGFVLAALSDTVLLFAAQGSFLAVIMGPLGWIGLAVVLVGAALLTWVFTEDPPLEQWLKNGPFSQKGPPILYRHHSATGTPGPNEEHERYVNPDDGSQLLLGPDKRILRIGSDNESFRQGPGGTIYQRKEDGSEIEVGRIGEPLDLNRLADRRTRFGGSFVVWKRKPKTAYYALVSALYSPSAVFALHEVTPGWQALLTVDLPNFMEGRSRLYVEIERKRTGLLGNWKEDDDNSVSRLILAEDAGSGPRTVKIPIPITNSDVVRAKVRLDLYGDGTHVLPADDTNWKKPKPIILECGPVLDLGTSSGLPTGRWN